MWHAETWRVLLRLIYRTNLCGNRIHVFTMRMDRPILLRRDGD